MEKLRFTPLPYLEADKLIREIYRRFYELRQLKITRGAERNDTKK